MRPRVLVVGAVTALGIGACASEPETTSPRPPVASTTGMPAPPAPPVTAAFGQDFAWDDGLAVTVHGPDPFTPSASANVTGGGAAVAFTLTVRNESSTHWDPALLFASLTAGDEEATPVFDAERGVGDAPDESVPPRGEVELRLAFVVPQTEDLVLRVTPGLSYAPAVFSR